MQSINIADQANIVIKTKINFEDLMAYRLYALYRKPIMLILGGWGILSLIRTAFSYHKNHEFPWDGLFIVIFFLLVFPIYIYLQKIYT